MAITRCPYCHAIIDENDKYCNNCGTQLLFNEDEEIEEEIPGEKIIEAEVEDKDYTIDEPKDEKRPAAAKDLDKEIGEELDDEELAAENAPEEDEGGATEEVILVDEIEAAAASETREESGAPGRVGPAEAKTPEPAAAIEEEEGLEPEDEAAEEELAEELEEEKEEEGETRESAAAPAAAAAEDQGVGTVSPEPACGLDETDIEYVAKTAVPDESATAGEAGLRPVTFDSKELENLGKTVEMGREKIDKFIEVMASKEAETGPVPAEPAPAMTPEPSTGTLPPWASTMKGAPVFPEDTGRVEPRRVQGDAGTPEGEEVEIFPRRRPSDSTIGLPEKVSQAPLPFEAPPTPPEEGAREEEELEPEEAETEEREVPDLTPGEGVLPAGPARPARELLRPAGGQEPAPAAQAARPGIELAGEVEEPAPRPPFSFSVFLKSKAFDILFVGLFWVVALWLAASSMGLTLFEILGSTSGSMLLLYGAFVLLYFFLFKFFLGETLGDRLFRPRE